MESLGKWHLEHWWKLLGAAGALMAISSAHAIFLPGVYMGLGLLFIGIGEWINHPIQTRRAGGAIAESYPWRFNFFGVLFDVAGAALFCFGLLRLLAFGP